MDNNTGASIEGIVEVLCHEVTFRFWGDKEIDQETEALLKEEAENRAETCIKDGYRAGELNYQDDEKSYSGWWEIKKD